MAGRVLVVSRPIASPNAIVSLASHEWERLPEAATAATTWPDTVVLLTLPSRIGPYNCHDCANRIHRLAVAGVAPSRVTVLPLSTDGTRGEALAVRQFALSRRMMRVLVVTSPYHTRRALAVFKAVFRDTGIDIGIQPASTHSQARPSRWWAAPFDRWYVTYEWTALAYYALAHGVWPVVSDPAVS